MKTIKVPVSILKSMRKIVDYNFDTECKDYEQLGQDGGSTKGHIFLLIKKIDKFLNGVKIKWK